MTSSDDAVQEPGGEPADENAGTAGAETDAAATPPAERTGGLSPAMKYTLWGVGAVVAVGIVITLILLLTPPADAPVPGAQSSSPAATAGPDPDATPVDGSEVQTPDPTETPGAGLPPRAEDEPLVTAPLPASASAEGELVDGFPADIMGPADDSDVLSSSIASEGDTMQVTLVARTDASEEDVVGHFRSLWSGLGLADAGSSGSAALSYGDEYSSLTLAFSPSSGTGTVYMVYAVLRAG